MNEQIRQLFPALENYIYLNSAAVSPIPTTAIEAINKQLWDVATHGSRHFNAWVDTKDRCRKIIAEMLNVKDEQIAFMRNTSDGFATITNGLDWNSNDNIVSFEREFPANFYPWRRVHEKFGVELRMCPERDGRIDMDEFVSLIDENTKLVAISAVQFASGFCADLDKIGEAARKVDALFAVDMIQALGTMKLDFPASKVDIASGASHKWLCSPEGCGIFYLSDRARSRVEPTLVGWISVPDPWNFLDLEQGFQPNALAWETGTGAASLFYGLEQSLKLLNDAGIENIQNHLENLTDFLCESLPSDKYKIVSSRKKGEKSQIVCVEPQNGLTSDEIFHKLDNKKIVVSSRNNKLRIAPHFYNNQEDIENLIENLP